MAVQNATTLKGYYETGDKPTQQQFEDLIDSLQEARDNASTALTTATSAQVVATTALSDAGQRVLRTGDTMTGPLVINQGSPADDTPSLWLTATWNNAAVGFTGLRVDITHVDSSPSISSNIAEFLVNGVETFRLTRVGNFNVNRQQADDAGLSVTINKRGTTGDDTAAVASGGALGHIQFRGWDGTTHGQGAGIQAYATETFSGSGWGTLLSFLTAADTSTTATERARFSNTTFSLLNGTVLSIVQGAITAASTPIAITTTWNNGAVAFGLITADVTDTASASTSSLVNLQVGSVDRVLIRKSGFTQFSRYEADNSPQIIELRKRGRTGDVNGAVDSGIIVSRIDSSGWNTAAYVSGAQISMVTTEAYTGSVNGTLIRFGTTATGSNSVTSVMDVHTTGLTMLNSTPIRAVDGAIGAPSYAFVSQTTTGMYYTSNTLNLVAGGVSRLALNSGGLLLISDSLPLVFGASQDTYLRREAANQLAMYNSTNNQTFRIYGTRTDASNYERLTISHNGSSDIFFITEAAGSGVARRFSFSGGDIIHTFTSSDTSGTRLFLSGSYAITPGAGSASFNAMRLIYTINASGAQTGSVTGINISATETSLNGFIHRIMDCRVGGTPIFLVNATGSMLLGTASGVPSGLTHGIWFGTGADLSANPGAGAVLWAVSGGEFKYRTAGASEGSGQNNRVHNRTETVTGAGTNYTLTAATAAVTFGTTSPTVSLPTAGTYLLIGVLQFTAGATGADQYRAKFRNTTDATDIGKEIQQTITTASGLASIVIQETVTVTATKNVQLFAHNQTAARGSITSTGTSITYVRLY